ncbi:MAG: hypothetical protein ACLFPQ_02375 [Candidatus Woesearchaeota archaeon]
MIRIRTNHDDAVALNQEIESTRSELSNLIDSVKTGEPDLENMIGLNEKLKSLDNSRMRSFDPTHAPAFILVMNYDGSDPRQEKYTFNGDKFDEPKYPDSGLLNRLRAISKQDNACLILPDGGLLAKHVYLCNLNPESVVKMNGYDPDSSYDMALAQGFRKPVGARHRSALAYSYHLRSRKDESGIIVYTLSEESGDIRRMKNGKITHSTVPFEGLEQATQKSKPI